MLSVDQLISDYNQSPQISHDHLNHEKLELSADKAVTLALNRESCFLPISRQYKNGKILILNKKT